MLMVTAVRRSCTTNMVEFGPVWTLKIQGVSCQVLLAELGGLRLWVYGFVGVRLWVTKMVERSVTACEYQPMLRGLLHCTSHYDV